MRKSQPTRWQTTPDRSVVRSCDPLQILGAPIILLERLNLKSSNFVHEYKIFYGYMIQRAFVSRDIDLLVLAYLVYVRPLVEYNSVVWSPYTIQDIKTIERVQRRFTKYFPGLRKLTYKERLHHLHLPSLKLRRLHGDLVCCYKILFGIVETPTEEFFIPSMCASTRGHQYKLFKKPHVSRIRANFFSERIVNSWNFLPDSVDFSSLPRFKRAINKVDFSQFLKCF